MEDIREQLLKTAETIQPFIRRTPIMESSFLNSLCGAQLFFKCENFQTTGSFKMRGASHAVASLDPDMRRRGIVAHSSGNFAQAVARSAQLLNADAYIVMPENAPKVKQKATAAYGAQLYFSESTAEARQAEADRLVKELGAQFLHPSNQIEVIQGQATCAMELMKQRSDLDIIITPVGGGGLIAGTALAAHVFGKDVKVIGAEPMNADDAYRSLASGRIEYNTTANTVADGLRTHLGDVNFPIIQSHVDHIIRISEAEIIEAMEMIWRIMKIIIEPSCALPLAAVLKNKEQFEGQRIGLILTGGNVDFAKAGELFASLGHSNE